MYILGIQLLIQEEAACFTLRWTVKQSLNVLLCANKLNADAFA